MFIKLTRFDNRPIWLNASFIVTVEPRKDGFGSVVVPIGDGFDYDVRESVAEVLAKLEGAPAAAVVPVPAPDCLTKTPADVSPEREPKRDRPPLPPRAEQKPVAQRPVEQKPVERKPLDQKPVESKPVEQSPIVQKPEEQKSVEQKTGESKPVEQKTGDEKKPRKRTTRSKKAEKSAAKKEEGVEEPTLAVQPVEQPVEQKVPPPLELSPDQVVRLGKLAPKSISKLKNTLATQFHVADVGATVLALEASGAFAIDGNRVVWPAANAAGCE